jgi:hypothetical protein
MQLMPRKVFSDVEGLIILLHQVHRSENKATLFLDHFTVRRIRTADPDLPPYLHASCTVVNRTGGFLCWLLSLMLQACQMASVGFL